MVCRRQHHMLGDRSTVHLPKHVSNSHSASLHNNRTSSSQRLVPKEPMASLIRQVLLAFIQTTVQTTTEENNTGYRRNYRKTNKYFFGIRIRTGPFPVGLILRIILLFTIPTRSSHYHHHSPSTAFATVSIVVAIVTIVAVVGWNKSLHELAWRAVVVAALVGSPVSRDLTGMMGSTGLAAVQLKLAGMWSDMLHT